MKIERDRDRERGIERWKQREVEKEGRWIWKINKRVERDFGINIANRE